MDLEHLSSPSELKEIGATSAGKQPQRCRVPLGTARDEELAQFLALRAGWWSHSARPGRAGAGSHARRRRLCTGREERGESQTAPVSDSGRSGLRQPLLCCGANPGTKAFVGESGSLAPWFLHMPGIPSRRASVAMARTDGEGCWDLPHQHFPSASSVSGVRRAMDTPGPLPDGAPYLLDPTGRRSTCSGMAPC